MRERGVLLERTPGQVLACVEVEKNVQERLQPAPCRFYSSLETDWLLFYLVSKPGCQCQPRVIKVSIGEGWTAATDATDADGLRRLGCPRCQPR